MVDEAYLHFLRCTFVRSTSSRRKRCGRGCALFVKTYGMAGLRCGFGHCPPDLIDKITERSRWNFNAHYAVAAAFQRALKDPKPASRTKRINAKRAVQENLRVALTVMDYSYTSF